MPNAFRRKQQTLVERTISELNYGSVCINQWPGLVYGLMTPPWGAAPGSTLSNIQSGIGSVHNLYFLDKFEKTVFRGPLCNFPKPIWFPSHKRAEKIAWKLLRFYGRPAAARLPGLFIPALLG
jgi:aldehyde dehydrogenase (NAD(P)+)